MRGGPGVGRRVRTRWRITGYGKDSSGADSAVAGLGLVRLPKWLVAPAVASGQLLQVFEEPQPFGFPMHLLWPHSRRLPLKNRVLIDLLAERLPGMLAAS